MDRKCRNKEEKSLAVSVACMVIYWPTPGFKGRTFKLCVLTRWDFNFCVRSSPLRGLGQVGLIRQSILQNKGVCRTRVLTEQKGLVEQGGLTRQLWGSEGPNPLWDSVDSINYYGIPVPSTEMKSRILWFHWSAPLVSCSSWSDRGTES